MSKNAFYKHFRPLVENGYIKISKAKGFKNKNVYTVCNNPKKINCNIASDKEESLLTLDGINAKGFGFIPKLIMCDDRLTIKSKALIAFLYSLVQSGSRAFPHRSTICTLLGLSKDTYYKALNQLIDCNYITVKQRHTKNGRFSVNDYILNSNPTKTPCPENCDNNNITSINSSNNISSSNLKVCYIHYTQNKEEIRQMIYQMTRYDDYSCNTDDFSKKYCKTVKMLIEMLCITDHALYGKQSVKTSTLFEYLKDCVLDDVDGLSLRNLICETVWLYDLCCDRYNIKRPAEYLKSLLWDNIKNFNL